MDEQDPGLQMVHLLRTMTMELDLFAAAFAAEHGLHATDLRALIHLLDAARSGTPATPGWLGGKLGLNSASITGLLDRLERAGHVRRLPDPADRRRLRLEVTERAVTLGWSFFGPLITDLITTMNAFDQAELATVRRFLRSVADVVAKPRSDTTSPTPP